MIVFPLPTVVGCTSTRLFLPFVRPWNSNGALGLFLARLRKCHRMSPTVMTVFHTICLFSSFFHDSRLTPATSPADAVLLEITPPPPIPFHRLKSPCWVDPTAASSLTKVIRRTGRVDDHARAHLAVSRGYVGGAWWVVSPAPFCARPTSHDFDWNDCALLGVRSRWSDLMTHDPNRKKQVQTGPKPIRRQTFQTEKKKKKNLCRDGKHAFATSDRKEDCVCGALNFSKWISKQALHWTVRAWFAKICNNVVGLRAAGDQTQHRLPCVYPVFCTKLIPEFQRGFIYNTKLMNSHSVSSFLNHNATAG